MNIIVNCVIVDTEKLLKLRFIITTNLQGNLVSEKV